MRHYVFEVKDDPNCNKIINSLLAYFVPQTQHTINVVRRFSLAGHVGKPSSWRGQGNQYADSIPVYGGEGDKHAGNSLYRIKIKTASLKNVSNKIMVIQQRRRKRRLYVYSSKNALMLYTTISYAGLSEYFPYIIGMGDKIALALDYRLVLNASEFYSFYIDVNNEMFKLADDPDFRYEYYKGLDIERIGLFGFGPKGLFVEEYLELLEKYSRLRRLFESDSIDKRIIEHVKKIGGRVAEDIRLELYLYYPSVIENKAFHDNIHRVFSSDNEWFLGTITGSICEKENLNLLEEFDLVVFITTDPLSVIGRGVLLRDTIEYDEEYLKLLKTRVFIIHYLTLYYYIGSMYYDILHEATKTGSEEEYKKYSEKIPVLALIDVNMLPIATLEERTVEEKQQRKTVFRIELLAPDVYVTKKDCIVEILGLITKRIKRKISNLINIPSEPIDRDGNEDYTDNNLIYKLKEVEVDILYKLIDIAHQNALFRYLRDHGGILSLVEETTQKLKKKLNRIRKRPIYVEVDEIGYINKSY